jgi:lysozyme
MANDLGVDLDAIITDLEQDEGVRFFVYDDATGKPITKGTVVIGNPTIGVGRSLNIEGLTAAETRFLLTDDIVTLAPKMAAAFTFWPQLNLIRRAVLLEMSFNMGIHGLLGFPHMLAAVAAEDWPTAVAQMKASHWHDQVGNRAVRLEARMLNGV